MDFRRSENATEEQWDEIISNIFRIVDMPPTSVAELNKQVRAFFEFLQSNNISYTKSCLERGLECTDVIIPRALFFKDRRDEDKDSSNVGNLYDFYSLRHTVVDRLNFATLEWLLALHQLGANFYGNEQGSVFYRVAFSHSPPGMQIQSLLDQLGKNPYQNSKSRNPYYSRKLWASRLVFLVECDLEFSVGSFYQFLLELCL